MKNFPGYVMSLRLAKGLTQRDLAKLCGVSYSAIQHLESGNTTSSRFELILALSKALGVSLDEMAAAYEGKPYRPKPLPPELEALISQLLITSFKAMTDEQKADVLRKIKGTQ